ncbi:MAG: glycosyltransferase [Desulfuromonadaceae bacterium]|nr:glycosyltransferase [Desulfuromonadaceae bacterium]
MNVQIITSSYPADPNDPSGTAGLFIRQFALELAAAGHSVVVQPAAKKKVYIPDPGISLVPAPWKGGDQELASINLMSPRNWWIISLFFIQGARNTLVINRSYSVERTLCMWAVPSGIFGLIGKLIGNIPYDIWALGSDIWKIRKIPLIGKAVLRLVIKNADRVFADGMELCQEVKKITGVPCEILYSSRIIPLPKEKMFLPCSQNIYHLLFVGRYHINKGPDLLIRAVSCLSPKERNSIHVHMYGLGPMENELRMLVAEMRLGNWIEINGPIEAQQLSNCLDSVSFLVIPSRIESIPVVFSDALQIGTPVVSMPVGDLGPLINEFGCGIVADEVTAQAFAYALVKAIKSDRKTFQTGVKNAFEKFGIESTVKRWLDTGDPLIQDHS